MGFVFVSRGFKRFQLLDLFSNQLEDCTEKDFDDIIVNYRSLFYIKYFNDHQDFYYKSNDVLLARRYYL